MITQVSKTRQKQNTQERGNSWMPQIKSPSEMCDDSRSLFQWHCRNPLIWLIPGGPVNQNVREWNQKKCSSCPFVFHEHSTQKGGKREVLELDCGFKQPLCQLPASDVASLCQHVPICKMGAGLFLPHRIVMEIKFTGWRIVSDTW